MKKDRMVIGFVMYPERGGYYPTFKIARTLIAEGFDVVYFGTQEFEDDVTRQGIPFCTVFEKEFGAGLFDPAADHSRRGAIAQLKHNLRKARHIETVLFHGLSSGMITSIFKKHGVGLLMIDALLSPIAIAAHTEKIPVISIATELVGGNQSVAPFQSTMICHDESTLVTLRIFLSWLRLRFAMTFNVSLFRIIDRVLFGFRADTVRDQAKREFEKIRRSSGLSFIFSEYGTRPVFTEFVLCPSVFEYRRALTGSPRHYIGHNIDLDRIETEMPWNLLPKDRSIIYCSLGTHVAEYEHAERFFKAIRELALNSLHYTFIISLGPGRTMEKYGDIPPNIIALARVPQIAVLQRSSLMITNGGLGTIKECIYFAVPMVVLPCGFDQNGNAARICYHKIGLRENIQSITGHALKKQIDRLISEKEYKLNILKMSEELRRDNGFGDLLTEVENRCRPSLTKEAYLTFND